jgi:glucan 1,3-beta-glucosidase
MDDSKNNNTQISVYTGRGMLLEGQTVWLYGTAVEHHALYQYQFAHTGNIMAGFIQTETPYWQPVPSVLSQPYPLSAGLSDPDYRVLCPSSAPAPTIPCSALGLRIIDSSGIYVYGAGLYSFFNNYSTDCCASPFLGFKPECQSRIFSVEGKVEGLRVYSLNTVGSQVMATVGGEDRIGWEDHVAAFPETVAVFEIE